MINAASSDSDSDISISASHADKRAAKAAAKAAAITAAEKKRLDDEEVIRCAKRAAAFTAKSADLQDDGLMSLAEYTATIARGPQLMLNVEIPMIGSSSSTDVPVVKSVVVVDIYQLYHMILLQRIVVV